MTYSDRNVNVELGAFKVIEPEGGNTMENEYWALSLNGNYMEEMHLSTIKDVLSNINLYHLFVGPEDDIVGIVHHEVFRPIFDVFYHQGIQKQEEVTTEHVAEFVGNIDGYDLIVYGDQDETTYALIQHEYLDRLNILNELNSLGAPNS